MRKTWFFHCRRVKHIAQFVKERETFLGNKEEKRLGFSLNEKSFILFKNREEINLFPFVNGINFILLLEEKVVHFLKDTKENCPFPFFNVKKLIF